MEKVNIKKQKYFNNELLELIIKEKGYTKKYVADNLGVTKGLVSQLTKTKHPSIPIYCKLCDFLEVEYDILLIKNSETISNYYI